MLRELWGTKNVYTYGVGGTGFSGLDCVLSMILPGDKVVVFTNGTFSAIDGLTIRRCHRWLTPSQSPVRIW